MPWEVRCVLDERMRFIAARLQGHREMAELCREFGISRKTGYKWWNRYLREGPDGLRDRSRAPHRRPHAIPDDVVQEILELRRRRRTWGPRKLKAWLQANRKPKEWPSESSFADILKRHGLSARRRRRRRVPPYERPFHGINAPNDCWSADYKGDFRMGNGQRCYPLTITDNASRHLIRVQALTGTDFEQAQPIFESAFREYGLPAAIRTDNGPPFASASRTGLTQLSAWFLKLGIIHERIEVGHPEQNGRHERMHGTLKAEACRPAAPNLAAQQLVFERFRDEYNNERPHEALGLVPPGSIYGPSPRPMPDTLPDPEYGPEYHVRKVTGTGATQHEFREIYVSKALAGERVGLREYADGMFILRYAFRDLGLVDLRGSRKRESVPVQPLPSELSWDPATRIAAK